MLLLILQGGNINWENKEDSKRTALHQAVSNNNLLYCELLVQVTTKRIEQNKPNQQKQTADYRQLVKKSILFPLLTKI